MPFQVTSAALEHARATSGEHPIFMNCLPALRGVEQTAEVLPTVCFGVCNTFLGCGWALLSSV